MIDQPRFMSHVALLDDAEDSCWVWVGAQRDDGLGKFRVGRRHARAHWIAWEIQHGEPVPANSRLEHQCKHPNCVRHWKLVGPTRKLTLRAIAEILKSSLGCRLLARRYGVSKQLIQYHRRGARLPMHNRAGDAVA